MGDGLRFEAQDNIGYFFYPDEKFDSLEDAFNELLELHQSGQMEDKQYVNELNRLIAREPNFIDLHAHLSFALLDQDKPKKALDAALAGVAVGNSLVPESFGGQIEWGHLKNRPFLRALHGVILANVRLRRHKNAVMLIDKLLTFNPNDNTGVRYLLGSELVRAGDYERAATIFDEYDEHYPPYHYEQALLHIMNNNWVKAATELRRGFASNIYIAEMLCGNSTPKPLAIWHGHNYAEPGQAADYINTYGSLWFINQFATAFVRWLFNHSKVLAERSALMACSEALYSEKDFQLRRQILDRQQILLNNLDDQISADIIKKVKNRHGDETWPWLQVSGW